MAIVVDQVALYPEMVAPATIRDYRWQPHRSTHRKGVAMSLIVVSEVLPGLHSWYVGSREECLGPAGFSLAIFGKCDPDQFDLRSREVTIMHDQTRSLIPIGAQR